MIETYIVDSFTDKPFAGNPAGVCLLETELTEKHMLSIANELSPKIEVELCGHATLAASKVVFENQAKQRNICFTTGAGLELNISKQEELIVMEFPIYNTIPIGKPKAMMKALGVNKVLSSSFNKETNIVILEMEDSIELRSLNPNFSTLVQSYEGINGVSVTAKSKTSEYDFESRFF
jgi:predicted PhzF superfamily epimerase YddE/YHI9